MHRLRVPAPLRRTLASTNVIESALSIVETVCRNVKRWRAGGPHRVLGGIGPAGGRGPVPQGPGLSRDSAAVDGAGQHRREEDSCRRSKGCVAYDRRVSLTFNGVPAISGLMQWKHFQSNGTCDNNGNCTWTLVQTSTHSILQSGTPPLPDVPCLNSDLCSKAIS